MKKIFEQTVKVNESEATFHTSEVFYNKPSVLAESSSLTVKDADFQRGLTQFTVVFPANLIGNQINLIAKCKSDFFSKILGFFQKNNVEKHGKFWVRRYAVGACLSLVFAGLISFGGDSLKVFANIMSPTFLVNYFDEIKQKEGYRKAFNYHEVYAKKAITTPIEKQFQSVLGSDWDKPMSKLFFYAGIQNENEHVFYQRKAIEDISGADLNSFCKAFGAEIPSFLDYDRFSIFNPMDRFHFSSWKTEWVNADGSFDDIGVINPPEHADIAKEEDGRYYADPDDHKFTGRCKLSIEL